MHIFHEPFTHCVINDLITDANFVNELTIDAKSKLKFNKKNNDLYKFQQVRRHFNSMTQSYCGSNSLTRQVIWAIANSKLFKSFEMKFFTARCSKRCIK